MITDDDLDARLRAPWVDSEPPPRPILAARAAAGRSGPARVLVGLAAALALVVGLGAVVAGLRSRPPDALVVMPASTGADAGGGALVIEPGGDGPGLTWTTSGGDVLALVPAASEPLPSAPGDEGAVEVALRNVTDGPLLVEPPRWGPDGLVAPVPCPGDQACEDGVRLEPGEVLPTRVVVRPGEGPASSEGSYRWRPADGGEWQVETVTVSVGEARPPG